MDSVVSMGTVVSVRGAVVDVDAALMQASIEVVAGALFSTDVPGVAGELSGSVLTALDGVIARARSPSPCP